MPIKPKAKKKPTQKPRTYTKKEVFSPIMHKPAFKKACMEETQRLLRKRMKEVDKTLNQEKHAQNKAFRTICKLNKERTKIVKNLLPVKVGDTVRITQITLYWENLSPLNRAFFLGQVGVIENIAPLTGNVNLDCAIIRLSSSERLISLPISHLEKIIITKPCKTKNQSTK